MKASIENIKEGDKIIFKVDEYRSKGWMEMDGDVLYTKDNGVEVLYLSGYKSRNDFIPWKDILAKVDLSLPWVKLKNTPFSGNFLVFDQTEEK